MSEIVIELALIIVASSVVVYIVNFFRQPTIVGYIITGLLIGPLGFYKLAHGELLEGLADIGITLLLFMVGLELNLSQLKKIGSAATIAGIGQIIFTCAIGFGLTQILGIDLIPGLFIAIALTFSSTIIVVKLLTEKKDLQSLYGKLAVGIFLIQDIAAIFLLVGLSSFDQSSVSALTQSSLTANIIFTLAKAFVLGLAIVLITKYILPKILYRISKSDEMLLLFGISWSLGLAVIFSLPIVGFNPAIGGFVAGLTLANTGLHYQFSGKVKSLRDFFIIIFFVVLGSQLVLSDIKSSILPALVLSLFVLIGNPLVVLTILSFLGYKPRTSFMAGITMAQISEFSLILIALAFKSGQVSESHVTTVTLVAIITIVFSSYGILYADKIYEKLKPLIDQFDFGRKSVEHEHSEDKPLRNHIILIGMHRLGSHLVKSLSKQHSKLVLIDFNPDVVTEYRALGYNAICGDIMDPYIQEVANIDQARLIISTMPGHDDNIKLLDLAKNNSRKTKVITTAKEETEAQRLYTDGATYVLLPHFVGGEHLARLLNEPRLTRLNRLGKTHKKAFKI